MTLIEVDEQLLQGRHHLVAVEVAVRMLHTVTVAHILETTTANQLFPFMRTRARGKSRFSGQ